MKNPNRLISVLLVLALVVGVMPQIAIPTRAAAYIEPQPPKAELQATQSGTCGENLTWTLDTETGVLTISGTGPMEDYSYNKVPWYSYRGAIRSVVIQNGVTSIGDHAFNDCSSLAGITIPASVTSIGRNAFQDCDSLTSITIPASVNSIGQEAFSYCSNLTSITILEGVTSIGWNAFRYCEQLTSITIPASVTTMGLEAFYGCTGLTSAGPIGGGYNIEFGWTTAIPNHAFSFCSNLTNITIPESVTSIGEYAFSNCYSLTVITIPESVTSIGKGAFYWCGSLTSITIPESVTSIGSSAFNDCSDLTWIDVAPGNTAFKSLDGVLLNWDATELIRYPEGRQGSYIVPAGVIGIGSYAFYSCESLTGITIPASVTSIGSSAFESCRSLTSAGPIGGGYNIEFGWTTAIPDYAFSSCRRLTNVTIPKGVTSIGSYAFYECSLTNVTIPEGVTSIGDWAFSGCDSLTSITIPEGVTSIGERAFYDCGDLGSITLPTSVTSIGEKAFSNCIRLLGITIPEGVTSIGELAFDGCSILNRIDVAPGNATYSSLDGVLLNRDATELICCPGGRQGSYVIPASVTNIGNYAFYYCSSLTSIMIPESVTSIGSSAFEDCRRLTGITIPEGVTSISDSAFAYCSHLTSITIPERVTSIGGSAFLYCDQLSDVYYGGTEEQWKAIAIGSRNDALTDATIHYNHGKLIITQQPVDYVGKLDEYASFTVAVNEENVTYQWYYSADGENWKKSGSTGSTTVTLTVQIKEYRLGQLYRCEVTNSEGKTVTSDAVTMQLPPSTIQIVAQPADYLGAPNDTATFTVEATGDGLTYQWYYSSNGGETWSKSYSEGYNTPTLHPILREYRSGQLFRCLITDANSRTEYTEAATMALKSSEISITSQPVSYTGALNDLAEFSVTAEGENLKYLWYYSEDGGATWVQTYNEGYNTPTVKVRLYAYRSGWQYKCVITSGGSTTKESSAATIAMRPVTVQIREDPLNAGGLEGTLVCFHVGATGNGLSYQWQFSTDGGKTWKVTEMAGAKTDTLQVEVKGYRDGWQYRCVVTDDSGTSAITKAVVLRCGAAPVITKQPESYTGGVDSMAIFTVEARGENLSYQWQYSNDGGKTWSNSGAAEATTSTLPVQLKAYRNGQQYRCIVTNEFGSVVSAVAQLNITE